MVLISFYDKVDLNKTFDKNFKVITDKIKNDFEGVLRKKIKNNRMEFFLTNSILKIENPDEVTRIGVYDDNTLSMDFHNQVDLKTDLSQKIYKTPLYSSNKHYLSRNESVYDEIDSILSNGSAYSTSVLIDIRTGTLESIIKKIIKQCNNSVESNYNNTRKLFAIKVVLKREDMYYKSTIRLTIGKYIDENAPAVDDYGKSSMT